MGKPLPPDMFRFWTKYFEPVNGTNAVEIPPAWAAFFTAALLNPSSFEWAKSFLSSPTWAYFSPSDGSGISFALPAKCPSEASSSCLIGDGLQRIASIEGSNRGYYGY